ncbi:hypothetical protein XYCOK13_43060 [Xylanibacillus composti]|uniref:Methionyl/Leucyl tRNA synthetase domain-containing protein n=1 Tax=Xylanibacillus composti TaxID=1572762 RepID=A0A8J4M4N3_9BACL|nr:hypothetical protein XYCOK13_43060 [Xylanibacillus composti]
MVAIQRILVTATPPTTNGDLHLGHLSGPYLGADVFTRAQRMMGNEVLFISSTDDNQSYLMTKAMQENRPPLDVIRDYSVKIKKSLQLAQIEMDSFTSPLTDAHISRVQKLFLELFHKGKLQVAEIATCYCETCARFLFEAYVKGECPTCGQSSGGQCCEECGHPNDPLQMKNARCTICQSEPIVKNAEAILFPIEPYRNELETYYKENSYKWRPHLSKFFRELLDYPVLPAFQVTNHSNWGIPVPLEGFEGQVINVWFEMLPGHMETTSVWAGRREEEVDAWWGKESSASLVQFFGFDNSIYYTVYHTAILIAHGNYQLADAFINNEFYLLDHLKFSTSRKHAIWGSEFFNEKNSDWLRLHLCLTAPELSQTNFSVNEFNQTLTSDAIHHWKTITKVGISMIFQEAMLEPMPSSAIKQWLDAYEGLFLKHYSKDHFSLRGAAESLIGFLKEGADYIQNSSASDAYAILRGLCIFSLPLTPDIGSKLLSIVYSKDGAASWDLYPQESLCSKDYNLVAALNSSFPEF